MWYGTISIWYLIEAFASDIRVTTLAVRLLRRRGELKLTRARAGTSRATVPRSVDRCQVL